jgi:hypothetical protein
MEMSGQLQAAAALLPEKEMPMTAGSEAGWDTDPDCKLRRLEKSLVPYGKHIPNARDLSSLTGNIFRMLEIQAPSLASIVRLLLWHLV